ncbi:ABC transporter substrate-binding protein [Chimaeribacter arupi]|uniref:ABC transporter substrate-binding protein n=2 Tax=Yersiniaceae TaxID=1903411 RepID=A0A2N5EKP7_9GAMM|nr:MULTISPECIES: ABC transporter substrate-binding protein [Yersiniaceae]MBS0968539.1 ABC transporter substrate-binding protein [Nissabacter archeti]PLR46883.1 ABC transporter substrate-binding protein [Chimaeribacter arupi]PLR47091.1 ABC transporter substrate-binding protein [Chimaeribacter arupi]
MKTFPLLTLLLALPFGAAQAEAARIDLAANQQVIHTAKNSAAVALLPPGFTFAVPGKLTVVVSALNSPPLSVLAEDNRTRIGSDIDIAHLLADSLGLELNLVPASWEQWPLGIASGKYDVALFNIAVTRERKTRFDFATYRTDTLSFSVRSHSPIQTINKPADVAGLKVIVGSGTNQENILLTWDKQNRAQGLPAALPVYVTDDAAASLALQSGRVDAFFGPHSTAVYKAALTGTTRVVGNGPRTAWVAATTRKGNGLAAALSEAINGTIGSGEYARVLARWGESDEQITYSQVNPPGMGDGPADALPDNPG